MKKYTFEEAMKKMEEIVEKLENSELPLEEMISLYSEGMELSKICGEKLQEADKTISQLVKDGDNFLLKEINIEQE